MRCSAASATAFGLLRSRVGHVHHVGGRPDQSPEQGGLRDDPRVVRGGGRGRDLVGQVPDVQRAADVVERPLPAEGFHGGQLIDGFPTRVQLVEHLEDPPVRRTIEVLGLQELDDVGDGLGRQHHRPEGRGLRLHVVGRNAVIPVARKADDVVGRADDTAHPLSPDPVSGFGTLRPGRSGEQWRTLGDCSRAGRIEMFPVTPPVTCGNGLGTTWGQLWVSPPTRFDTSQSPCERVCLRRAVRTLVRKGVSCGPRAGHTTGAYS